MSIGHTSNHTLPHTHGAGVQLEPAAQAILERGLNELVHMTEGMTFVSLNSDRYPLPIAAAVYSRVPDPEIVRQRANSLLESAVFSHRAALHAVRRLKSVKYLDSAPDWDAEGKVMNEEMILITQSKKEVQSIMSNYVGIVRSNLRLQRALDRLEIIYKETELLYHKSIIDSQEILELRNLINVAYLVIKFAQERKQSIGLHYNIDYQ